MCVQNKCAHKTHRHIVTACSVTACFAKSLVPIHAVRRYKNNFPLFSLVLALYIYIYIYIRAELIISNETAVATADLTLNSNTNQLPEQTPS